MDERKNRGGAPPSDDAERERRRAKDEARLIPFAEHAKIFIDFGKHLTTVATGSIVLIATFITKQPNGSLGLSPREKVLLTVSIAALVLSIIAWTSLIRSVVIIVDSYSRGEYAKVPSVPKTMLIGMITFLSGIVGLGAFAISIIFQNR